MHTAVYSVRNVEQHARSTMRGTWQSTTAVSKSKATHLSFGIPHNGFDISDKPVVVFRVVSEALLKPCPQLLPTKIVHRLPPWLPSCSPLNWVAPPPASFVLAGLLLFVVLLLLRADYCSLLSSLAAPQGFKKACFARAHARGRSPARVPAAHPHDTEQRQSTSTT